MASLTIRDIPDEQKEALARIARANGRSMEAYLREMIARETGAREPDVEAALERIDRLAKENAGWGNGETWNREELYKDR